MSGQDAILSYMLQETARSVSSQEEYSVSDSVHLVKPVYIIEPGLTALWFARRGTPDTAAALRIRSDYVAGQIALAAPDCLLFHLADRLKADNRLPDGDIVPALRSIAAMRIVMPLRLEAACRAAEIVGRSKLTMDKAVYLAEAEVSGSRLLTTDEQMASSFYACLHIREYG